MIFTVDHLTKIKHFNDMAMLKVGGSLEGNDRTLMTGVSEDSAEVGSKDLAATPVVVRHDMQNPHGGSSSR